MAAPRAPRLDREFFDRPTLQVAREILGARLVKLEGGKRLAGIVIEAEAYIGEEDRGCHARSGRTRRNEVMFGLAGHAYVYFTYGMHWMLNVVTEAEGRPAAVLLRALWPEEGRERMLQRRGRGPLLDGPAKLCQALAIDRDFNGHDLCARQARLFFERAWSLEDRFVLTGARVGLFSVPEPWRSIPWRFRVSPQGIREHGGLDRNLLPRQKETAKWA